MLQVQFSWIDSYGRTKRQTLTSTSTTIAAALVDVVAFAPIYDAVADGGLSGVSISIKDTATTLVAAAASNIDVNASLQVQGADSFKYDLNLPMINPTFVTGGGSVVITDPLMVAFTDQFLVGGSWRMNNRFPTAITSVIKGQLDK